MYEVGCGLLNLLSRRMRFLNILILIKYSVEMLSLLCVIYCSLSFFYDAGDSRRSRLWTSESDAVYIIIFIGNNNKGQYLNGTNNKGHSFEFFSLQDNF